MKRISFENAFSKLTALLVCSFFVLVGCTKKDDSATTNIGLPNWEQLTAKHGSQKANGEVVSQTTSGTKIAVINRVMINVSGDGPTQVRIWDIKDYNYIVGQTVPKPPDLFTFDIKRGVPLTFQVLAVLTEVDTANTNSDDSNGPMTFYYGDIQQTISRDGDILSINLANEGTASSEQGNISGRYLAANGTTGPSGQVNMYYSPSNGRPEMIVDTSHVFSGFFNLFIPSSGTFSYRMASSGETIFNRITLTSFDNQLGANLMRLTVPTAYRTNSGGATRRSTPARTKIVGFVGPGANVVVGGFSKKVCYTSTQTAIPGLYVSDNIGISTQVDWKPAATTSSYARLVGSGGVSDSSTDCPAGSGTLGSDYLVTRVYSLTGGDSAIGMRGPFKEYANNDNTFLYTVHNPTPQTLTLSWKYMPAVVGNGVDGVRIYKKLYAVGETIENRWYDSAPCSKLTTFGYSEVATVPYGSIGTPTETYAVPGITSTEYMSGRYQFMICPYSNANGIYDFALIHRYGSGS